MTSKLPILYVCNSPAVPAGVEKTVLMLLTGMDRERFEPRVVVNGPGPFADNVAELDVPCQVIAGGGRLRPGWLRQLKRVVREHHTRIVQLHLSRLNAPFLRRWGCGIVERLNMTRHASFRYPLQWRWLDLWTARWIDRFIVVSESLRDQFVARGYVPRKLKTIHNGVRLPDTLAARKLRGELGLDDQIRIIGTVGRLTEQKGMDKFIEVCAALAADRDDLHFVIAGAGELRKSLADQATAAGLTGRMTMLGYRQDVFDVLAGLDVLVYLSRWEPFANTLLEAMIVGTPVVASNVAGNREALAGGDAGGLLVPVDRPDVAAVAVRHILTETPLREDLARSGRLRAAEFTVADMVTRHQDLYTQLVEDLQ